MTLAFYAPLKSPDHPVPSGDRAMACGLMTALDHAGFEVTLASTLRTRDGRGEATAQAGLIAQAKAALPGLIARGRAEGWQAWITYHNYYKAPDLLGPEVARALKIPYVLLEATRARKRLTGPWARFAEAAEAACDQAELIFYLTERDAEALRRDAPAGQDLRLLHPFLTREDLPFASTLQGPMLAVGMMREGDKLASYKIIAEVLQALPTHDWQLEIAGDGEAREEVAALMAPFGDRVRLLGKLNTQSLAERYGQASLLLWPGVNEAFGMIYLEAQAHGLPVAAQDRPGVRDVLAPGEYPAPEAGAAALADKVTALLAAPAAHQATARGFIAQSHLLPHAAATLRDGLASLGVTR